jgi:hypothetical protein
MTATADDAHEERVKGTDRLGNLQSPGAQPADADRLPVNDFLEMPVDPDVLTARAAAVLAGRGGT